MTTQRQAIDNCINNNDYNSSNDNSNNKNNNYKKRCFVFFNFNQIFWLQCISEATKNIISNVGTTTTTTTISTKKIIPSDGISVLPLNSWKWCSPNSFAMVNKHIRALMPWKIFITGKEKKIFRIKTLSELQKQLNMLQKLHQCQIDNYSALT